MSTTIAAPAELAALNELKQSAYRIRRYALRMGEVQGQGYIGQALGWADVLAVAYSLLSDWVAQKTPDNQAALDQLPPDKQHET